MTHRAELRVAFDVRCLDSGNRRGFARYSSELLSAMRSLDGLEIVAVADRPVILDGEFEDLVVHAPTPGSEWKREQFGIARLVRSVGADVLFSPANRGLPLFGSPSVLTLHDAVEWDRTLVDRPTGKNLARFMYSNLASLAGATRIITVSNHSANRIESDLGIDRRRIAVVPEAAGRSFRTLPNGATRKLMRREMALAEPYLLYVGGFDPKKSVDTLVTAWSLMGEPAPRLVLAGSVCDDERGRLLRRASACGADPSRLIFPGYVPDRLLPALMSEAEVFVFPAVAEGFGLPAAEAMALSTATVVADAGALPESTMGAAPRFVPGDAAGLAAILRRLVDNGELRQSIGEAGRAAQLKRSWVDVAAETAEVLAEAARTPTSERVGTSSRALLGTRRWVA